MNREHSNWRALVVLFIGVSIGLVVACTDAEITHASRRPSVQSDASNSAMPWQSPAKLRHAFKKEAGDLTIAADGVEFKSDKRRSTKWPFLEIQTFRISAHGLAIETYQSREHHLPGVERYNFELERVVPPEVAAGLAQKVHRPSQNTIPDPESQSTAIFAHHRTPTGGTNGTLRFHESGIDYLTNVAQDNRSWRWADLQTISNPDPYHLLVFGYRDTYSFDLKQRLPPSLFDRLTDAYAADRREQGAGNE